MKTATATFSLYWTAESVEIRSLKTELYIKIWANRLKEIPAHITLASQRKIAANKKAKKTKTLWDTYYGKNQHCQIQLDLTQADVYALRELSQTKAPARV